MTSGPPARALPPRPPRILCKSTARMSRSRPCLHGQSVMLCWGRCSDVENRAPVALLGPTIEHHPRFFRNVPIGVHANRESRRLRCGVFHRGSGGPGLLRYGACAAAASARVVGGSRMRRCDSTCGRHPMVSFSLGPRRVQRLLLFQRIRGSRLSAPLVAVLPRGFHRAAQRGSKFGISHVHRHPSVRSRTRVMSPAPNASITSRCPSAASRIQEGAAIQIATVCRIVRNFSVRRK